MRCPCPPRRPSGWARTLVLAATLSTLTACGGGGGGSEPNGTALGSTTIPGVSSIPAVTMDTQVVVRGTALLAGSTVDVAGGLEPVEVVADGDGSFEVTVPLKENRRNRLFVRETSAAGVISPVVPLEITADQTPPAARVDSPSDGSVVFTTSVDVTGRISDTLSGFAGLSVVVNGVQAEVNVGQGTNGTFIARGVTLSPNAASLLEVRSVDAVGNEATVQATVFHQTPTGDTIGALVGDGQTGSIHEALGAPLEARLVSAAGQPLVGRLVTFEVVQNDGRVGGTVLTATGLSATVPTDGAGVARAFWRLGGTAGEGNQRVEATAMGADGVAIFRASAAPGPASQINVAAGHNQRSQADGPAADLLSAWVSDGCNGKPGVPVTFQLTEGEGYLLHPGSSSPALSQQVVTDSTGHARVQLVHGPEGGRAFVEANFANNPGGPVAFACLAMPVAPGKETTFSGIVLDNASRAIGGAVCELHVGDTVFPSVTTNEDGAFRIENVQAFGFADLSVNGRVADTLAGQAIPTDTFPSLHFEMVVVPEAANTIGMPILLPELLQANERLYSTTTDTVMEIEGVEGLRMTVLAGSMTIDGAPAPEGTKLSLNEVRVADIPMPLPNGADTPLAWTLQPGGAHFDPPVEIEYPNLAGLPAGTISYFLSFDHDTGRFEIVATGRVTPDGSLIQSDLGGGLTVAGWGGICPPYGPPTSGESVYALIVEEDVICVAPGVEVTLLAFTGPDGGDASWSGGNSGTATPVPVGSTYRVSFDEDANETVTCTYTVDGVSATDSIRVITTPEDITIDGNLGDVITIRVSDTGLDDVEFVATNGSIGTLWDELGDLSLEGAGLLHFTPSQVGTEVVTLQGTCFEAPLGTEPTEVTVTLSITDSYSSTGPDRVRFGTTPLDVLRQQQRLRYLGFRSADGQELEVDSVMGARTREAIGLFCAAVEDGNSTAGRSTFTAMGQAFINAAEAPRWVEIDNIPNGYQFNSTANRWATSWLQEILIAAAAIHQPPATYTINDLSRSGGGFLSPHNTHRAGMDMDVEEPTTTDDASLPWFEHHGGAARVAVATGEDLSGTAVTEGDLIQRFENGQWHSSVVPHGASVPATWDRTTAEELIVSEARMLDGYLGSWLVERANYDRDELQDQFTALFAAVTPSGASCGTIFWNDPFFYFGDVNFPGQDIRFVSGLGGHFQMNVLPASVVDPDGGEGLQGPAPDGLAAHLDQFLKSAQQAESQAGTTGVSVLLGDWSVEVDGSQGSFREDGSFVVPNITIADNYGPGGPGTDPDSLSDDLMRVKAVRSPDEGDPLYAVGPGLRVRANENTLLGNLTLSETPAPEPVSIALDIGTSLFSTIGETAVATVTAVLTDGSTVDATGVNNFTSYTMSNPDVIGIDENGLITARGNGVAYVRAVTEGVTASKLVTVAGGDPLTTVIGTVVDDAGNPVAESTVQAAGFQPTALTNSEGQFLLENIPTTIQPTLTITASKVVGAATLSGSISGITPNPGGITDAGVIEITDLGCGFDPEFGPSLNMTNPSAVEVPFTSGFTFPFFGTSYSTCFVQGGGFIAFGGVDSPFLNSSVEVLQRLPRICPAYSQANLNFGGEVHVKQESGRFVVTWSEIAIDSSGLRNTFQAQLFADGRILFLYNGMEYVEVPAPLWVAVTPGSATTVPREVEFGLGMDLDAALGEAVFEFFGEPIPLFQAGGQYNDFDLDQRCIEWTPTLEGGMDVEITGLPAASYSNGGLTIGLPVPDEDTENAAQLSLEVTSSSGRSWRKPLWDPSVRRSAFTHLPIPASYSVRLLDGERILATGQGSLTKRGERASIELKTVDS